MYICVYMYIQHGEPGPGALSVNSFPHGRPPPHEALGLARAGPVADQKRLHSWRIHHKTLKGGLWDNALQQADSDAAIDSFWL